MTASSPRLLNQIELALLCLFAISLPLFEAPKNIFGFLFIATWLGRSLFLRNIGHLPLGWVLVLGSVFAAALASCVLTPYPPKWRELHDVFGYLVLALILGASRLTERQLRWLLACIVLSTLAGVIHGLIVMPQNKGWLQLNSVGHVNHSAMYFAGVALLVIATMLRPPAAPRWLKWALSAAVVASVGFLVLFASRGALVPVLVGTCVLLSCIGRARLLRLWPLAALGVVAAAGVLVLHPTMIVKTVENLETGKLSSYRVEGAHTAIEIFRQYPLSGAGAANFSAVSPKDVQTWVEARGETFKPEHYLFSSHAHTLYFNTLAERGLLGILALTALCIAWIHALVRRRPRADGPYAHWLAWSAGVAGFMVVFVGGFFNTMLHHEHGMLATIYLGLLLGQDAQA